MLQLHEKPDFNTIIIIGAALNIEHEKSAFEIVSCHHQSAEEILQRVRLGTSGSTSSANNLRNSLSEATTTTTGSVESTSGTADGSAPGQYVNFNPLLNVFFQNFQILLFYLRERFSSS